MYNTCYLLKMRQLINYVQHMLSTEDEAIDNYVQHMLSTEDGVFLVSGRDLAC